MRPTALAAAAMLLLAFTTTACGNDDAPDEATTPTPTVAATTDSADSADTTDSADSDSPASAPAGSDSSYCALLAGANDEHFTGEDAEFDLAAASEAVSALTARAPAELRTDWELMDGVIRDFVTVLSELDLTFDDLDAVLEGSVPEGSDVDPEAAWEALGPVFEAITTPEAAAAQERLQEHAQDECDVALQLGMAPGDM